jgi:putative DNA primase/helicase
VVANGILDLTTGELHDTTPDEYHQTMLDVAYDPTAECPAIDSFLHDVVDEDDVPTLYRLVAHTLYKEYAAEKAAMLLGDGRNGKSVFLSLVEEFLGEWNVSNQSLQELNEDKWAAHNLLGKLANVHPDMSDQTVQTMQMFKKLTGRDTVSADVKFEDPVRFENYATLIFACNRMPVLNDDTRGNWRRWLLIDFPNTFEPGAEDTRPKEELMAEMTTEAELQGLLARCVDEITAWDDGRAWFPTAPSWEEARRRIRRAAEPVYDFAHVCLDDSEDYVSTDKVRRAYRAYAKAEGLPTKSREEFGRELLNQIDYTVEKKRKRIDGTRQQVYDGVELTSRGEQLLASGVDEEKVDSAQSSMGGGPQGRAGRIVELCDQQAGGDEPAVPHDLLVGMAMGEGMDRETAEAAIAKAKNQGDLYQPNSDGYLPASF